MKEESTEMEEVDVAEEVVDGSHASSERARPNRTQAERIDRALGAFTEGEGGASGGGGFDADGNVAEGGGDDAADARARLFPMIPGVAINRIGKPVVHQPPRGTPGWASKRDIHPRRRTYKVHAAERSGWGTALRPALLDAPGLVGRLLGQRRFDVLRATLARGGRPTTEEQQARAFLAVVLDAIDHERRYPEISRACARSLIGTDDEKALRKIADLRRRLDKGEYAPELVAKAQADLRSALGRLRNS